MGRESLVGEKWHKEIILSISSVVEQSMRPVAEGVR